MWSLLPVRYRLLPLQGVDGTTEVAAATGMTGVGCAGFALHVAQHCPPRRAARIVGAITLVLGEGFVKGNSIAEQDSIIAESIQPFGCEWIEARLEHSQSS